MLIFQSVNDPCFDCQDISRRIHHDTAKDKELYTQLLAPPEEIVEAPYIRREASAEEMQAGVGTGEVGVP